MHSEETISDYRMKQTENELFQGNGAAQQRSRELREVPLRNAFLMRSLLFVNLAEDSRTLTEGIDLDIPEL